jgi:hypothetical protein
MNRRTPKGEITSPILAKTHTPCNRMDTQKDEANSREAASVNSEGLQPLD